MTFSANLEAVIHALPAAVILTDAAGQIEWVNDSFTRMSGYSLDEARGKRPGALLQGIGTDPQVIRRMREAMRAGHACSEELLNFRKDRTPYWANVRISPLRDESGGVRQWVGTAHDVSERKATERQLFHLHAKLAGFRVMDGMLVICARCHKIRDGHDHWVSPGGYLYEHSEIQLSHGLCPDCGDLSLAELARNTGTPGK